VIGVIADDLTGAAELGAVGLRHGLRAEIILSGEIRHSTDLVCVDTDSRSCTPGEAADRTAVAASRLRALEARWIYKKVDSVLRGQVTAELEAIMSQLGFNLALLAPANPSLGRVILAGRYFIRGRPLHESEFAHDPEYPRRSSDVLDLLATAKRLPIRVCRAKNPLPASGIVIGETGTPRDLQHWAGRLNPEILPAGGVEFFAALMVAAGHAIASPPADIAVPSATGGELFICGSASESANEFVHMAKASGTPVFSLPETLAWGAEFAPSAVEEAAQPAVVAFRSHRRIILNIGLPPVREPARARLLAVHLSQVAQAVLRQASIGHVYVEGGATAVELLRRLGWKRLEVCRELAQGVVTLTAVDAPSPFLTIKPGSYRWPDKVREVFVRSF
jgi:D-threonate/D-erythronate kinase